MAQTFTKLHLSGSTDGAPIVIAATATPGTTIHTATTSNSATSYDEVWLWASSTSLSNINLSVGLGTIHDAATAVLTQIPPAFSGPVPLLQGVTVRNGRVIQATASTGAVVNVFGYVNRISEQPNS